ncbi:MAG: cell wall hydrolase [Lachnospiraceae bacterium]|nr:cell wall hydrolase [Lachnospiraceae bacterium]
MTKLGKAAAKAVMATCLAGCFFLANPYEPVVKEQQVYEMSIANAGSYLEIGVLNNIASDEMVNLSGNREVAGVAAVTSGDLDFTVNDSAGSGKATGTNEEASANGQKAETDSQKNEAAEEEKVIAAANVENSLNIRKKPDEKSDVVGKLFRGCTAEVIDEKGDWYKISSGGVKGWVSKDYVLTGEKADGLLNEIKPSVATVTAKSLNLRKSAGTDADVVAVVKKGADFMVISEGKEWVKVRFTTNLEGYVSAEYVKVTDGPGEAVSIKTLEEYVKLAEEKEAERQAAKEAAEAASREAAETSSGKSSGSSKSSSSGSSSSYSAASDDVTLLAALCQYEAGTNYDNCLAVANVVLNRVRSSSYPNSIRGVIYQSGQFGTVTSGALNRFLSAGPSSTCVSAAKAALSGSNNIGGRLQFRATWATDPSSHSNSVVIGDNCFF